MNSRLNVAATLTIASLLLGACASTHSGSGSHHAQLTEADVIAAQLEWGQGIVDIARVHAEGGDFKARATTHINTLYAYGLADVMFKPTLAAEDQFRETFDEALAYFIGKPGTEDKGFAISGWTAVRWENNAIYTDSDSAMAMGNYYFSKPDGSITRAYP